MCLIDTFSLKKDLLTASISATSASLAEIVDGKDDAPAGPENTDGGASSDDGNTTAPETGIALAVVPAVIALAAATVTKRR